MAEAQTSPPPDDHRIVNPAPQGYAWATWPLTLLMIGLWLAWRLIHLRFFHHADLIGDEANYWECARRLQLSYHFGGPGIAAVVAAAVALFGNVEWGMRFPAAIAMALTAVFVARLANRISGDARAGFFAALLLLLFPLAALWSVFITYDPLYVTCWMAATYSMWVIVRRHREGAWPWGWWAALGLSLGLGFLLKYTIVLLVLALVLYLIVQRRTIRWDARLWGGMALSLVIFALAISPVLIWNQQQGWPTLTYLRAHLNQPTDMPQRHWQPVWLLRWVGAQIGLVGAPALPLLVACIAAAWRRRRQDADLWDSQLLLLCSGLVIIAFFTLALVATPSEGNWAMAGYPPLAVLAGLYTAAACRAGAWPSFLRRVWKWCLGLAVVIYFATSWPTALARVPVVGPVVPLERFWGAHQLAEQVSRLRQQVRAETGLEPMIIADYYSVASQMAFYLPDHPSVYAAASYRGRRRNTYDFWEDTDMTDPSLRGRPAILLGADPDAWRRAILIGEIRTIALKPEAILVAYNYQGVQPAVRGHGGHRR